MHYRDKFINLTDDFVEIFHYSVTGKPVKVPVEEIDRIVRMIPTLANGKYRFHGTGDFRNWFAADYARSRRPFIYRVFIRNQWTRKGFSVEDDAAFAEAIQNHRVLSRVFEAEQLQADDLKRIAKRNKSLYWLILVLSLIGPLIAIVIAIYG
jgi:hypothetical protein